MTERSLENLLERLGEQTTVGPPPIDQMVTRVARRRRRRITAVSTASLFAVGVIASGTVILNGDAQQPSNRATEREPAQQNTPGAIKSADTPTSLDGTWRVNGLVGDNGKSVLASDAQPIDIMIANGHVTGVTGCSTFTGALQDLDETERVVTFGSDPPATLESSCVNNTVALERLARVRHFNRANDDTLTLHAQNWMILFDLRLIRPTTNGVPDTTSVLSLPCPQSEQTAVDLDIPGPGRPNAEEAVAPFAGGLTLVTDRSTGDTRVLALRADGTVFREFQVTQRDDGWWPDGYRNCSG